MADGRGSAPGIVSDIVADYAHPSLDAVDRFDEMIDPVRGVREPWGELSAGLRRLGIDGLAQRQHSVDRLLADDGVTYRPYGTPLHQPWTLDPVPLLLGGDDWRELEAGVRQRAELLDLILADLYGERELLTSGLIPAEVVFGHTGFVRAVDQIRIAAPRQLFLTGADLARDHDGRWRVITDRTQAPSGAGYAMENRRVMSRVLPELYRDSQIQRVGPFFHNMRMALQQLAPRPDDTPRVVLLTPGAGSETAFDQAFLSALLGFPLVEGADLTMRDGRVWQRSIGGPQPVDVIFRRVDAWFCDPLELRPESRLGVPGLVEAARLGSVAIVNGLGTGVLENAGLFPFLPRIAEVLLSQSLRLPSVPTWWCGHDLSRRHVLARLDSLVIKPISREVTRSSIFGWELSGGERDELARRIESEPHAWVGQDPLVPSTTPTTSAAGLEARPMTLRTFAVAEAGSYHVLTGGLCRVAPEGNAFAISGATGARAKDVWILAAERRPAGAERPDPFLTADAVYAALSPRVAEDLLWLGRYAERAESLARLIGVAANRWRDAHPGADPAVTGCLDVLLDALAGLSAVGPEPPADTGARLLAAIADEDRPGTIAHATHQLRDLASAVRDQLSGDTWSLLARLERAVAMVAPPATAAEVAPAVVGVIEALLAFAGLGAESMVRDQGWHLLDAGRRTERALQLLRLIQVCLREQPPPAVEQLVAESVLIATESIITHRRRYGAAAGVDTVLRLLLFDRDNPRSVTYQLHRLDIDLRRVSGATVRNDALADRATSLDAALHQADRPGLASAPSGHRDALDRLLTELIDGLHELAEAIAETHFPTGGELQPFPGMNPLAAAAIERAPV